MRKDSLVAIALLSLLLLPGCAAKSGAQKTTAEYNTSALFAPNGRNMLGNTQKSTWQKFTAPVTDNMLVSGFQQGASKFGAFMKSESAPKSVPDALSLERKPKTSDPRLQAALALMKERNGQIDGAIEHYEKALKLDPQNLQALLGYAHLLDRTGRLEDAVQYYQHACSRHPEIAQCFNDLGLCLARMDKLEESLGPLQRAVALSPDKPLYRNNVATVLVELGRTDEALEQLKGVHNEAVAHYNLAHLLQRRDQAAAVEHFARASAIDPSFAAARQWMQKLNASMRREPVLQQSVAQTPLAQTPLAMAPVTHTPVAQMPLAQTPVAGDKTAVLASRPLVRHVPVSLPPVD